MIYKVYVAIMITTVILVLIQIFKIKFNKRNIKNEEIIILNVNLYNFIYGFLYLISFIIWLILLKIEIQKVDFLFKQDYVNNVFQLLNFECLENLRKDFYDNSMIIKNYCIVYFLKQLPYMLFWINFSLWMSILFFYKGYQRNIIYETGILVNSAIIDWNKIIDYKWSNVYKKRIFDKGKYYNLVLTLPKFYDLDHEVKLKVSYNNWDKVDDILKKYTNKENL